jgi:hypothetical protein
MYFFRCILYIFLAYFIKITSSHSQTINWTGQISGSGADYISDMITDKGGNIYICGWFEETINLSNISLSSAGEYDMFIAKYNSSDSLLWVAQAGGNESDMAKGLSFDLSDNLFVTGYFEGNATFGSNTIASSGSRDVFLSKYDTSGNLIWTKYSGGSGLDEANAIATDPLGNILITGIFNGTASFDTASVVSNGYDDIFIISYSNEGDFQWTSTSGGFGNDNSTAITCDNNSNVYVSAWFNDTILINDDTLLSAGKTDVLIAKYDVSGNLIWAKKHGGGSYDYSSGIIVTSNEVFYLSGYFYSFAFAFDEDTLWNEGESDIFIALFDTAGNYLWSSKAGGKDFDLSYDLFTDLQGNAYITGAIKDSLVNFYGGLQLPSNGGYDAFAAKYNQNGDLIWADHFGGEFYDYGYAITTDSSGTIYIGGTFENSMPIGNDSIICEGLTDIFITSYSNTTSNIIEKMPYSNNIFVLPNPSDGEFTLFMKEIDDPFSVLITNQLGEVVFSEKIQESQNGLINFYLSKQPGGLYFLAIHTAQYQYVVKIVLQ